MTRLLKQIKQKGERKRERGREVVAIKNHGAGRALHVMAAGRGQCLQAIKHTMQPKTQYDHDNERMHMDAFAHEKRHYKAEQQAFDEQLVVLGVESVTRVGKQKDERGMDQEHQIPPGDPVRLIRLPGHTAQRDQQQGEDGKEEVQPGIDHEAEKVAGGNHHRRPGPEHVGVERARDGQWHGHQHHHCKHQVTHRETCLRFRRWKPLVLAGLFIRKQPQIRMF